MSQWAIIRIPGFPKELEDKMKTEATEFLGSSPCEKQLCVYERSGYVESLSFHFSSLHNFLLQEVCPSDC